MAKTRMINTKLWSDSWIREKLNPLDRYLFLYFLTNEHTNICGIYELPLATVAYETGIDKEDLKKTMLPRLRPKVFYIQGWVCVTNFSKHQAPNNPKVKIGVKNEIDLIPSHILNKATELGYSIYGVSHLNQYSDSDSNSDLNITTVPKPEPKPFSLKEEIKKLEENPRRDLNILGLFFERKKPDLRNYEQYKKAFGQHLPYAIKLKVFDDDQILKACSKAEKEYPDIWTVSTLVKILTK